MIGEAIDITVLEKVENPDTSLIPKGSYCYTFLKGEQNTSGFPKIKTCPYYRFNEKEHHQNNGYCAYLGVGDWEENSSSLLWDMIKECGINDED